MCDYRSSAYEYLVLCIALVLGCGSICTATQEEPFASCSPPPQREEGGLITIYYQLEEGAGSRSNTSRSLRSARTTARSYISPDEDGQEEAQGEPLHMEGWALQPLVAEETGWEALAFHFPAVFKELESLTVTQALRKWQANDQGDFNSLPEEDQQEIKRFMSHLEAHPGYYGFTEEGYREENIDLSQEQKLYVRLRELHVAVLFQDQRQWKSACLTFAREKEGRKQRVRPYRVIYTLATKGPQEAKSYFVAQMGDKNKESSHRIRRERAQELSECLRVLGRLTQEEEHQVSQKDLFDLARQPYPFDYATLLYAPQEDPEEVIPVQLSSSQRDYRHPLYLPISAYQQLQEGDKAAQEAFLTPILKAYLGAQRKEPALFDFQVEDSRVNEKNGKEEGLIRLIPSEQVKNPSPRKPNPTRSRESSQSLAWEQDAGVRYPDGQPAPSAQGLGGAAALPLVGVVTCLLAAGAFLWGGDEGAATQVQESALAPSPGEKEEPTAELIQVAS